MNLWGYVDNPIDWIDPFGLFESTPAIVFTDMTKGRTVFYDPVTQQTLADIPTRSAVSSRALPGAGNPYSGLVTYCQRGVLGRGFGTAKMRTTDPRYRWIHGGGSRLGNPYAPNQGWAVTLGCTRAQNQGVEELCDKIDEWKSNNPGREIRYIRDNPIYGEVQ